MHIMEHSICLFLYFLYSADAHCRCHSGCVLLAACRQLQVMGTFKWIGTVRLMRLLLVLILIVHWLACLWHYLFERLPGV